MIHPLTFLKGAGLGAGIMYFFDPVAGNRRRDRVRDQFAGACTVCNEASDRLLGAGSEIRSAIESSDQPIGERVEEGMAGAAQALGMEWSPSAKTMAMIGGAGLVASLMNKRDLAAIAFGIVGLTFVAKELADGENMRMTGQQRSERGASQPQQGRNQSRKTQEKVGAKGKVRSEK